ncbi:MAG: chemotaxis protein CheR [Telmatospirillum sp.]|nr:chemotaxis protein CheR [Telmatospirillum sp.]
MTSDPDSLSTRSFSRLAALIEDYSGIAMPANKKTLMEGRLRRRARALGLPSLDDYCRALFEGGRLEGEVVHLIDAVTTNKTDFFREQGHFRFLTETALPGLMTAAPRAGLDRPFKVWSAACSIGAEPYSVAMVVNEFSSGIRGFRFSVLGTDISSEVLAIALEAIYPWDMITPFGDAMRRRYALRSRDPNRPCFRIAPVIRSKVQFARLNLMDDHYPLEDDWDVIFCRNILIYFERPVQFRVVERLVSHLRPGGYLFLGHSEGVAGFSLPLRPVAHSIFQKL